MEYTPFGFKKPELSDYVNIGDLNDNADMFDAIAAEIGAIIPILDAINGEVI